MARLRIGDWSLPLPDIALLQPEASRYATRHPRPEDVVLLEVEQAGGIACHTGRHSCFFQKLEGGRWVVTDPVLKDPKDIYKSSTR
jgi:hypothetical protein